MTNFEKYKDEILKIAEAGGELIGVKDGKPVACESLKGCGGCDLAGDKVSCLFDFIERACAEDGTIEKNVESCENCAYFGMHDNRHECTICSHYYTDNFKPKPKRTRRDEFLEHYPNANVLGIQPCSIEKENFGEYCGKYDECSDCIDDYWAQEAE